MKREISFIIPCYNEHPTVLNQTIKELDKSLKESGWTYEILVVNDGSQKFSYKSLSGARLIQHKVNRGYGASLKTGIQNAKYGWIGITDADGTYPNRDAKKFLAKAEGYDMVIGLRDNKSTGLLRSIPKFFLMKLASILSNTQIPDLNSGLRIFKKELARKFWNMYPEGFSFTSTITMASFIDHYDVLYIPIDYYKRKGKSTIHPIKDTIRFFSLVFRMVLYFNPLRVFIPVGLVFLLLSIIRGARDFMLTQSLGGLTLVLFFLAVQTFFFGLVADLIIKRTKL